MNRWLLGVGCWLLCVPTLATRRALLVGIGTYPAGRVALSSGRDVRLVEQTLHRQRFTDVAVLTEQQATADGIRGAFADLLTRAQSGDLVVLLYAGHGTQLPDQNGDERRRAPRDALDECLVPFDAPRIGTTGWSTSTRFIRDDELGAFLDQLQTRLGPTGQVLLLADACHSGTLTRGQARLRTDNFRTTTRQLPEATPSDWLEQPPGPRFSPPAPLVLMAACRPDESSREISDDDHQAVGPLSYVFCQAVAGMQRGETYQSLFQKMRTELRRKAPEQTPQLEGDARQLVWRGDVVLPDAWSTLRRVGERTYRAARGWFAGCTAGSSLRLTRGDGTTLTGKVTESGPFEALLQLDEPAPDDSLRLPDEPAGLVLPPWPLRVAWGRFADVRLREQLVGLLHELPNAVVVAESADWLLEQAGAKICLLQARDGKLLECWSIRVPDVPERVAIRVAEYARATFLRALRFGASPLRVSLRLQAARLTSDGLLIDTLPSRKRGGLAVFRSGEHAWLTLHNDGGEFVFFTLIEIGPTARLNVLLPDDIRGAEVLRLAPGQTYEVGVTNVGPPFGRHSYQVLLSRSPLDVRLALISRESRSGFSAGGHPLSRLLSMGLRGQVATPVAWEEGGAAGLDFWLEPN
jgi:hypothetical protein